MTAEQESPANSNISNDNNRLLKQKQTCSDGQNISFFFSCMQLQTKHTHTFQKERKTGMVQLIKH